METLTRRKALSTALNAAASIALPASATAAASYREIADPPEGCDVVQVTGDAYAPAIRKGDYIIHREGDAKPGDRIVITLLNGAMQLAELVHRDPRTITARPLQPGARLQSIPVKSVKDFSRVVAVYSPD